MPLILLAIGILHIVINFILIMLILPTLQKLLIPFIPDIILTLMVLVIIKA